MSAEFLMTVRSPTVSVKQIITGPMDDAILRKRSKPMAYDMKARAAMITAPT